ncbi:phospholipid phosphatase 3-like [Lampris incognitus]|uniref:phospholipid phosphatase 3-like n=1 Tax=Lampris incognitus TaxID=2546036 RepID=UPI0024B4AD33|nr:phospholipid phosphatase 3-like [Lampris incognitus]
MQKSNFTSTHTSTLPRDAELQLRLADNGGAGEAKENGAGKHFLPQHEENSLCTKRRMLVGLDVLCLCVASIPFFACELKAVTPYRRGFFCGDSSITYPFLEREAIPDSLLIAGGIIITGLTIALGECYRVRFRGVHSRAFVRNRYVSCLYKELGSFLFGCCVGQSLTNMAKLSVGRLRPNFLSVCNITYASINCTPGSYVSQATCRQSNHKMVEEARAYFPRSNRVNNVFPIQSQSESGPWGPRKRLFQSAAIKTENGCMEHTNKASFASLEVIPSHAGVERSVAGWPAPFSYLHPPRYVFLEAVEQQVAQYGMAGDDGHEKAKKETLFVEIEE